MKMGILSVEYKSIGACGLGLIRGLGHLVFSKPLSLAHPYVGDCSCPRSQARVLVDAIGSISSSTTV